MNELLAVMASCVMTLQRLHMFPKGNLGAVTKRKGSMDAGRKTPTPKPLDSLDFFLGRKTKRSC